jgi:hypothetical protein
MAFSSIPSADIAAGKPVDVDLMTNIKDNDDALFASAAGALFYDVPNGDMELTGTAWPANWYDSSGVAGYTAYPGGTGSGIETTSPVYGSQSMRFTHPGGSGNGGGFSDSEYLPCGYKSPIKVRWLHYATAAGMKNQVLARWFDEDKVGISTSTLYNSVANPTTTTLFTALATPPSTARFLKIRLVGGESSVDVAGDAFFDAVSIERLDTAQQETFTATGTFDVPPHVDRVFVDACGGGAGGTGGGSAVGGGGGAGGEFVQGYPIAVTPDGTVAITIGAGGAGGAGVGTGIPGTGGTVGGNTIVGSLTLHGGNGGATGTATGGTASNSAGSFGCAGGAAGSNGASTVKYAGGSGAGGGGGGGAGQFGAGGASSTNAAANTGGGGGGGYNTNDPGGNGGSGKVIIYW